MPKKSRVKPQVLKQIKITISFNLFQHEIHLIHYPDWDFKSLATCRCSLHEPTWEELLKSVVQHPQLCSPRCPTRFVSSKDNGSLGRRNGWSVVLTWFMSDRAIRKTTVKLSLQVRKRSPALEKMLCHGPWIPMSLYMMYKKFLIRFRHLLKSALTELYSLSLLVLLDTVCVFLSSGMCPLVLQVVSNTFTLQHDLYPAQSALKWRDDGVQWVAVNTHVCSLNTIYQLVVQVPTMEGLNVVQIISLLLTSKSKHTVPVLHLGCSDVLVNI